MYIDMMFIARNYSLREGYGPTYLQDISGTILNHMKSEKRQSVPATIMDTGRTPINGYARKGDIFLSLMSTPVEEVGKAYNFIVDRADIDPSLLTEFECHNVSRLIRKNAFLHLYDYNDPRGIITLGLSTKEIKF
jgi:hypothetical protein